MVRNAEDILPPDGDEDEDEDDDRIGKASFAQEPLVLERRPFCPMYAGDEIRRWDQ